MLFGKLSGPIRLLFGLRRSHTRNRLCQSGYIKKFARIDTVAKVARGETRLLVVYILTTYLIGL